MLVRGASRIAFNNSLSTSGFLKLAIAPRISATSADGEHLHELSQNEIYVKETVATLNAELSAKTSHLETESSRIRKRLGIIDREIDLYVQALGKGRLSVERLEAEIGRRQDDKEALEAELEELERRISENTVRDFDAELVSRNLRVNRPRVSPPRSNSATSCAPGVEKPRPGFSRPGLVR